MVYKNKRIIKPIFVLIPREFKIDKVIGAIGICTILIWLYIEFLTTFIKFFWPPNQKT